MIRKIILHVGLHKTGTTSFQNFILQNEALILGQGIHPYKPIFRDNSYTANEVGLSVLRSGVMDDIPKVGPWNIDMSEFDAVAWREQIRARIKEICDTSDCETLLISGEYMSFARTQVEIDKLKSLLPPQVDTHIIMALREKSEWWRSYCSEVNKWKHRVPGRVDASRNSHAHLDPSGWLCDFDTVKALFCDNFSSVSMPAYTAEGMVKVLLSEIGIVDVEIHEPRSNTTRSSTPQRVSWLRRIYRHYISGTLVGSKIRKFRLKFGKKRSSPAGGRTS